METKAKAKGESESERELGEKGRVVDKLTIAMEMGMDGFVPVVLV